MIDLAYCNNSPWIDISISGVFVTSLHNCLSLICTITTNEV